MTALGIGPGCEVIVPAFFWVATAGAVVQANAIPVLCEVDDSFCMDPRDLARKITPRTKLIVPVHMAGAPCDMKAIMAVAEQARHPRAGGTAPGQRRQLSRPEGRHVRRPGHVQPAMEQERHGRRGRADRHQRRRSSTSAATPPTIWAFPGWRQPRETRRGRSPGAAGGG